MQKCAKICKVLLSNNVIGHPYYRRRETKPIGVHGGIIWLMYHHKAYDVMKAKIKRPIKAIERGGYKNG